MRRFSDKILSIRFFKGSFLAFLSLAIIVSYLPHNIQASHTPNSYYVSVNGSDSNDGSDRAPWRTIQYGINQLNAGDTLYVREGVYYESLTINKKGRELEGYITVQAYPGEKAVISGKDSNFRRLVSFENAHYIIFDGFELRDLITTDSGNSLSGIRISDASSNIYIQNNNLHRIEHQSKVSANANGIRVYGDNIIPIKNVSILNNTLSNLILGSSEALTIVGNVDGFVVANNTLTNNNNIGIDVAGFYGTCATNGCDDQPRNGLVSGNSVSYSDTLTNPMYGGGMSAAAIYVDGGRDTIIEGNFVSHSNFGFSISSEQANKKASGIIVRNNIMYKNHRAGLVIGGSSRDNGGATDNSIVNNNFILNNTINDGYGEITYQHHAVENIVMNNIFYGSNGTPLVHHARTTSFKNHTDYNIYFTENNGNPLWRYNDVALTVFSDYQKASSQDQNSLVIDPMFQDVLEMNFNLSALSPAIDKGNLIAQVGMVDYIGSNRIVGNQIDIGAYEATQIVEATPTSVPMPTPIPTIIPVTPTSIGNETPAPITPTPIDENSVITIDGFLDDWDHIPALSLGTSNVKELKALLSNDMLYVALKGQLLKEKGQLYVFLPELTDVTFNVPHWSNKQAHYLIENGILYKYTGNGSDWKWLKVKSLSTNEVVISNNAIEYAILINDLSTSYNGKIEIGYIWKDSAKDALPFGGNMNTVPTPESIPPVQTPEPTPQTQTPEATPVQTPDSTAIIPTPTFVPTPTSMPTPLPLSPVVIDGKYNDWSEINVLASNNDIVLKVTHDTNYLYLYVESKVKLSKDQFYLNTDKDSKTGYQTSLWSKGSGIDYLLEEGILYSYKGNSKNWSFAKVISLNQDSYTKSNYAIELKVALKDLNLIEGSEISLGFMPNDAKKVKLPLDDALAVYVLN